MFMSHLAVAIFLAISIALVVLAHMHWLIKHQKIRMVMMSFALSFAYLAFLFK